MILTMKGISMINVLRTNNRRPSVFSSVCARFNGSIMGDTPDSDTATVTGRLYVRLRVGEDETTRTSNANRSDITTFRMKRSLLIMLGLAADTKLA
jgi:hypothetical protein